MNTFRRHLLPPALLTVALVLSACGSGDDSGGGGGGGSDEPYRVVVVAAQSGPLAVNGTAYLRGIQIAADELNAEDGVNGRQVEVEALDSKADATEAVSLLRERLDSGPKPDLVLNGTISNETIALLPILAQNEVLSCQVTLTSDGNDPAKYPYHFGIVSHAVDQGVAMAEVVQERGFSRIGLLQQNNANGQTSQQGYVTALEDAGLTAVAEQYDPEALDMTAPLQRLEEQDVDVIVVTANGPASPYVLQSRLGAGITTPTILDGSITVDIAALASPEALEGVSLFTYAVNVFTPPEERSPAQAAFLERLEAGGDIDQIMYVYAAPHDCLRVAALGAEQAGSTDAAEVTAALEGLEVPDEPPYVTWSKISFDEDDHFVTATEMPEDYQVLESIPAISEGTWAVAGQ